MLYNVRVVSSALWGLVFYNFFPNALSEMNQIQTVSSISTENVGSVCLMVLEKIDARTDRRRNRVE